MSTGIRKLKSTITFVFKLDLSTANKYWSADIRDVDNNNELIYKTLISIVIIVSTVWGVNYEVLSISYFYFLNTELVLKYFQYCCLYLTV